MFDVRNFQRNLSFFSSLLSVFPLCFQALWRLGKLVRRHFRKLQLFHCLLQDKMTAWRNYQINPSLCHRFPLFLCKRLTWPGLDSRLLKTWEKTKISAQSASSTQKVPQPTEVNVPTHRSAGKGSCSCARTWTWVHNHHPSDLSYCWGERETIMKQNIIKNQASAWIFSSHHVRFR